MKDKNISEKKKNFIRISENRVNKILVLFNQLKNLTNKSFYEYSGDDIEEMFSTLQAEMDATKKTLLNDKNSGNRKRFEL